MARQFQVRRGGIPWKRLKIAGVVLVFALVGISLLKPGNQELQALRSPDGKAQAELSKYTYVQPHLRIRYGQVGERLRVVFTSVAITNAFDELQPHLSWTGTPARLRLHLQERVVWELREP